MTRASRLPLPAGNLAEPALAVAVVATLFWTLAQFFAAGYLPQPFFYEPSDTWMDWFNTAYWAHNAGAYDSWGTIYPPLSFVVLKYLTNGACYATEGLSARDCDWFGAVSLHVIFLLNAVLIWKSFRRIDSTTAIPRTIALNIGMPMLFGLERGNLVLLTLTFVLLAFGPLVRSARLRWVFAGLAINLKVYLIGSIFAYLLHRRWRWFEGALLATILVYLVSFALLGAGTPWEIYSNISNYSSGFQAVSLLDLWYAGTYQPLISLLNSDSFPVAGMVGSRVADFFSVALPLLIHLVQLTILIAAAAAWLRPGVVPRHRTVFLAIAMALITAESGGYTEVFLILFVFMEPWRGIGSKYAIVIAYLLCLVGDIPIERVPPIVRDSFLGGRQVIAAYSVGIGPFIRPLLVLSLPFALSLVTIRAAWADCKASGRRSRSGLAPLIGTASLG